MSILKAALVAAAFSVAAIAPITAFAQQKVPLRVMNGDGVLIDEGGFIYTGKITDKGMTMMKGAKGSKSGYIIMMHDGQMFMMPVATSREAKEMLNY
ncbi:MAG: hypothetical protein HY659_09555 [Rhizobiales bacterium]|nr:hypothetical protein [Hyphomicrobiales bacterium]